MFQLKEIDPFTFLANFNRNIPKNDRRDLWVFLKKTMKLAEPITLKELQEMPELKTCQPIVSPTGSLFKLTPDEYEFIRKLIDGDEPNPPITPYSREEALKDLFLSETQFDRILSLLRRKKNIIL